MIQGSALWFVLLSLGMKLQVGAAPICVHGHAGCHSLSLADLFDRVIQHSARIHGLSSDLHTEFEQYVPSSKNLIGERKCHTSVIQTPNGKDIAQSLTRGADQGDSETPGGLGDPLSNLNDIVAHWQDFNTYSGSKALDMIDMVHQLRSGVQRVAERMQLLGMISNSLSSLSSTEMLDSTSPERFIMSDHDLLYCLRRDTDKVQSYLRILKCTILPEQTC